MKNNLNNQGFSTFDVLTVLGSVFALVLVTAPILGRQINIQHGESAKARSSDIAELMAASEAKQLSASSGSNETSKGQRQIASVSESFAASGRPLGGSVSGTDGEADLDPWGHPYQYHILKNAYGQPTHIAVWSFGPNSKNDTDFDRIRGPIESAVAESRIFGGDDIGNVRPIRH